MSTPFYINIFSIRNQWSEPHILNLVIIFVPDSMYLPQISHGSPLSFIIVINCNFT